MRCQDAQWTKKWNIPWKPGTYIYIYTYCFTSCSMKNKTCPGNQGNINWYYIYICHETFIKQIRNKNMPWKPGETNIYMPWKPGKYTHALETREIYTCPGNQGKQGNHIKLSSMNKKKKHTCPGNKMYLGMMVWGDIGSYPSKPGNLLFSIENTQWPGKDKQIKPDKYNFGSWHEPHNIQFCKGIQYWKTYTKCKCQAQLQAQEHQAQHCQPEREAWKRI